MTQNDWVGKTLGGRYQLDEIIGQGGMSAVYKATDPNLQRVVAVKMIHAHLSGNEEFVRRFEEEATAVAQLRHPNIIQVFDFNNDDGTYYMVLEFVPGETVQQRLKRLNDSGRQLPIEDGIKYAVHVCEAADYAHQRGMIHRDIKPANVMLDVHNQAILMDFGIAKMLGGQSHTATGAVIGTALYMSPEQIQGQKPDARADVYSIGVTLFEMISGRTPYDADSAMTLMMMHVNDPIPDLRQIQPGVPPELAAVIEKSLAKDRGQRYQSAAEMAAALRKVTDGSGSAAAAAVGAAVGATMVEPTGPDEAAPPIDATFVEEGAIVAPVGTPPAQAQFEQPVASTVDVSAQPAGGMNADGTMVEEVIPVGAAPPGETPPAGPMGTVPMGAAAAGGPPKKRSISPILIGVIGLVLCLVVVGGGALAFNLFGGGGDVKEVASAPTRTEAGGVALGATTAAPTEPLPPTETQPPTATLPPTEPPTPTLSPTPTVPPGIPYVLIKDITSDGTYYVVEYETFEYTEALPGMHVHFFYDTVPPEEAGVPGGGPWKLYGGPRPFKGYALNSRPNGALQMCALVANSNHSVQSESGNCFPLPGLE